MKLAGMYDVPSGSVKGFSRRRAVGYGIATLTAMIVGLLVARLPSGPAPRPLCHRAIDGALQQWMLASGHTNDYPNANGNGPASLAMLEPYFGAEIQQYAYVPGLREGDPADLVFMFLKRRTRYTWHGDTSHHPFSGHRWMVLSHELPCQGKCPEGGELLSTEEFTKRLRKTIAHLKERGRPHWQAVADEQLQFVRRLEE